MTGEDKQDNDIDPYMNGQDGLSETYRRISGETPSEAVDDAILAASRKAVGARPARIVAPFSTRWHVPLSIAAVLVLSVLLVFNITDETVQVRYDGAPEMDRTAAPSQMEYGEMESNTGIRSEEQAEDTVMMKSEEGTGDNRDRDLPADDAPASRLLQREVPAMMPAEPPPRDMRAVPESIAPLSPPPSITTESAGRAAGSSTQPRSGEAGTGDEAVSDRVESPADDGSDQEITVTAARRGSPVECTTPRPEFCADIYQPVCAVRDTGVRCITTPCDSTEEVEYGNACEACSDPDVISYTEGRCEQE